MNAKRFTLLLASLLAFGCGVNSNQLTVDKNATVMRGASDGNGTYRTFSFDYKRAEQQEAARTYPVVRTRTDLPTSVDLREKCSPVGDQGKLGSCTAWAMGRGLREFMEIKNGEQYTQLAPLYFYYKERELRGTISEDSGATITDGMTVLKSDGICPEIDWPYDITKFAVAPSADAEKDAAAFKVASTVPLRGIAQIKTELANGNSVAFGFRVFKSFMGKDVASTGIMPMPQTGEQILGGHAVLMVGYDDAKKVFIVRNSWGTKWGDKGYFYMPYDNMKYSMDFWTAK